MARHLTLAIFLASLTLISAHCQKKYGQNESIDKRGNACEPRCGLRYADERLCPLCTKKTSDYRCHPGFLRDEKSGLCVDPQDCTICDFGESRLPCGRKCEATHRHPFKPKSCSCKGCKPRCRCDFNKGYVRDTYSGRCVAVNIINA
ncbi:hypothetical protein PV325_013645 [Microctonus aethiopoides]|uniref:Uncharacterized protein n=1 Tax=Microctonus aethiopoides TaxID=144406 RepID=A0AA39KLQ8_9HYME|nr:hypothetical protein PV325_013645 [Microctonus aethiopoides]KAK0166089.1 hypothetical protein PV328_004537 [Microctonus aethiopoides]